MEVSDQRNTPAALPPGKGKDTSTNLTGGWVDRRASVDMCVDEEASPISVGT
jgi:hypothetical protein